MIYNDNVLNELNIQLNNSYSPYSGCKVACVLEFEDKELVSGCNVENASYSLTLCAERNAVTTAISKGFDMRKLVKIYIKSNKLTFFTPYGACLQVLSEFLIKSIPIVVLNCDDKYEVYNFNELMPVVFDKGKLD